MQIYVKESSRQLYKRLFVRVILAIAVIVCIVFILPKTIGILWPFVIAFIVATIINPITSKINKRFRVSRRVVAVILDVLVFLIVSSIIGLLVYSVVKDVVSLANAIQQNWDAIIQTIQSVEESAKWLLDLLPPAVIDFINGFEENLITFLQNFSKELLNTVVSVTGNFATRTGSFFVNFIMYILAAYFMIVDYTRITDLTKKVVGNRFGKYFSVVKSSALKALGGYVKSQLLLALFAFIVMFAALGIYGQPYAFLIALLLGFIDLLPIVGTIAVLLPWGIIEWASGDVTKGLFLIILGAAFFIVRKFVEPKIVGSQTGLHPLAALISMFVGLQFSGVWGAVLGPVVLMLIIGIVKSGIFDNTILDLKDVGENISVSLRRPSPSKNTDNQNESIGEEYSK